jgi:hypothetical protein
VAAAESDQSIMMFETTIAGSLPKLDAAPHWRAKGSTGPGRRVQRLIHLKGECGERD